MEAVLKKALDKHLGDFLKVNKENVIFNPGQGQVSIKEAEIKSEIFADLHFPVALKGGFIHELSMHLPVSIFSDQVAKVVIKDVFFVFGPHTTDWSWEHVHKCKTRLVDFITKGLELKAGKKADSKKEVKPKPKGGFMADMKKRMVEEMKKKFLGMLEVHISNLHYRFEDWKTQERPFVFGFKIGFIGVTSKVDGSRLRTTGEWKSTAAGERHGDLFFCQAIQVRRTSMYWDVLKNTDNSHIFSMKPIAGLEIFNEFKRMNVREFFQCVVVEKILAAFPPDHKKRKQLEGPCFRERLDYHQYILFPASVSTHVTVNQVNDATVDQKAPLKDVDAIAEPFELALDTEQVRSINQLLEFVKDFEHKDQMFHTRPREFLQARKRAGGNPVASSPSGRATGSSSSPPTKNTSPQIKSTSPQIADKNMTDEEKKAAHEVARAWWQHAFQGVRIASGIPRSQLNANELKKKARLREKYISLFIESSRDPKDVEAEKAAAEKAGQAPPPLLTPEQEAKMNELNEMQLRIPLADIIAYRTLAIERRKQLNKEKDDEEHEAEAAGGAQAADGSATAAADPPDKPQPKTMQLRVHFKAFQAYFLIVSQQQWNDSFTGLVQKDGSKKNGRTFTRPIRQLLLKGQMLDVWAEMVQRGTDFRRLAKWTELGVGSINATNCVANKKNPSVRQILSIVPFEHRPGTPLCLYVGMNALEAVEGPVDPGAVSEVPLSEMLKPVEGAASHFGDIVKGNGPQQLEKMGFLKEFRANSDRVMIFAFGRLGQVRALHYAPFGRRLELFLKKGKSTETVDLLRRPSQLAAERELLTKLQRKVEKLTGKAHLLSVIEGITDGVRVRLVDHYNKKHVLCKEVSMAPMRLTALRNGSPPSFHLQFHQKLKREERRSTPMPPQGEAFGLLPWKVAMLLLPKADFDTGLPQQQVDEEDKSKEKEAEKEKAKTALGKAKADVADPTTTVLAGMTFLKWCRNQKAKPRFVIYDDVKNEIQWKNNKDDKAPIGVIPISKVQDICTGISTPVLEQVRSNKLRAERVFSIVTAERTLDLQAGSTAYRELWVAGLKSWYKKYVQGSQGSAGGADDGSGSKQKPYPQQFRSDRRALSLTYTKLSAVTALSKGSSKDRKSGGAGSASG
eukprot:gnl/MRDRNA2_/MRDRNA2_125305_c0_seq1.p1 gnl/MRDRNA2_/MRDRNA2_125305_c0~~gnl/MRDRNA2_/MRDRNA2_125305_c0_seq1.p1  ORF type:complete len:1133 (+),score=269.09 gnl/MRDRNA2_/MRDRNA2_125305_c0_seq1:131-3529(+)